MTAASGTAAQALGASDALAGRDLGYRVSADTTLLTGVDVSVRPGQITGVLGPNGAGKSTLLRLAVGALTPSSGTLHLGGTDTAAMRRRSRARQVAFVAQDSPAEVSMQVLDVVLLGRTPHRGAFAADGDEDVELARRCLSRAGALNLAERDVATLSGGERQRVHLARALAQEPQVLILDEPTNHLDVAAQLDVLALIREVAATGTGVLMAMHDLGQAAQLCDEVLVLRDGYPVTTGVPRQVLTPELIAQVWRVEAEWVQARSGTTLVLSPLAAPIA